MPTMTIRATDASGTFSTLVVEPRIKPAAAVLVIHEIFGVNDAMRASAAWVADLGFFAFCPDLFWRIEPGIAITDKTQAEWKRALELFDAFDQKKGIEDLKATLAAARAFPGTTGKVGTLGFCLGGRLAFMMAEQSDADVNVSYYGVALDTLLRGIDAVTKPLVVHIAEKDQFFSAAARARVVAAAKGRAHVRVYVYPNAGHAFARVDGTHWHGRSAAIANGRTAEALVAALG